MQVFSPLPEDRLGTGQEVWINVQYKQGEPLLDYPTARARAEEVKPGCTEYTQVTGYHPGLTFEGDKGEDDPYMEDWWVLLKATNGPIHPGRLHE